MINRKIPTLLGVFSITVGLIAGTLLVKQKQALTLIAALDTTPKNIRVTNINDSAFTISWTSSRQTVGLVKWGEKEDKLKNSTQVDAKGYLHSFTIDNLLPTTTYYFSLVSEGTVFDNNGIVWKVKTGPQLPQPLSSQTISGTVVDQEGKPVSDALIYATVGGSSPLSTRISVNGSWVMPISEARDQTLLTYIPIDIEATLVELHIQTKKHPSTLAQIYPISAQPSPPIVVGKINNFKNLINQQEEIPQALIKFPDPDSQLSGFGDLLDK